MVKHKLLHTQNNKSKLKDINYKVNFFCSSYPEIEVLVTELDFF